MEEWLAVSSSAADKPRPLLQNSLAFEDSPLKKFQFYEYLNLMVLNRDLSVL